MSITIVTISPDDDESEWEAVEWESPNEAVKLYHYIHVWIVKLYHYIHVWIKHLGKCTCGSFSCHRCQR